MLIAITIVNVVLWTGVITTLLFVFMRQTEGLDLRISELEISLESDE